MLYHEDKNDPSMDPMPRNTVTLRYFYSHTYNTSVEKSVATLDLKSINKFILAMSWQ